MRASRCLRSSLLLDISPAGPGAGDGMVLPLLQRLRDRQIDGQRDGQIDGGKVVEGEAQGQEGVLRSERLLVQPKDRPWERLQLTRLTCSPSSSSSSSSPSSSSSDLPPCLLIHGAIENGLIFHSRSGKGREANSSFDKFIVYLSLIHIL